MKTGHLMSMHSLLLVGLSFNTVCCISKFCFVFELFIAIAHRAYVIQIGRELQTQFSSRHE